MTQVDAASINSGGDGRAEIKIRLARPQDSRGLERLAQLDSATALRGEVLLAEQGASPVAAISLQSGKAIADPFRHTADVVAMLRLRRRRLAFDAEPSPNRLIRVGRRTALPA